MVKLAESPCSLCEWGVSKPLEYGWVCISGAGWFRLGMLVPRGPAQPGWERSVPWSESYIPLAGLEWFFPVTKEQYFHPRFLGLGDCPYADR